METDERRVHDWRRFNVRRQTNSKRSERERRTTNDQGDDGDDADRSITQPTNPLFQNLPSTHPQTRRPLLSLFPSSCTHKTCAHDDDEENSLLPPTFSLSLYPLFRASALLLVLLTVTNTHTTTRSTQTDINCKEEEERISVDPSRDLKKKLDHASRVCNDRPLTHQSEAT